MKEKSESDIDCHNSAEIEIDWSKMRGSLKIRGSLFAIFISVVVAPAMIISVVKLLGGD